MNIYLLIICVSGAFCLGTQRPQLFNGSPEVFSGYLPDSDKYVKAFMYHEDCAVIEGNAANVSWALAQSEKEGMFLQ